MSPALKIVLEIIASAGGGAAIVYILITKFGNRVFEHELQKLSERYKFKLNLDFDRISKINQKEFDILPTVWDLITDYRSMMLFYSDKKKLYDDLNKFNPESLYDFLKEMPMPVYHKQLIMDADNKNEMYLHVINEIGIEAIKKQYFEFDTFYKKNKIFYTDKIADILAELHKFYFESFELFIRFRNQPELQSTFRSDFDNTSKRLTDQLGVLIKGRLRFIDD